MGLDALGDAYWIRDRGREFGDAVRYKHIEEVKETVGMCPELFSDDVDSILFYIVKNSSDEKYVTISKLLLKDKEFSALFSYIGLFLAKDEAEKSGNKEVITAVEARLNQRTKQIQEEGVEAHLKRIRSRTVTDDQMDNVILGRENDVILFAVETQNSQALVKLASTDAHKYMDGRTFELAKEKAENAPEGVKQVLKFILDAIKERQDIENRMESLRKSTQNMVKILGIEEPGKTKLLARTS